MSCFKKDGTLRKVYAEIVPLLLTAEPHHAELENWRGDKVIEEYDCFEYYTNNRRYRKYLDNFLDETGIENRKMYSFSTCYYQIFDLDEVRKYC